MIEDIPIIEDLPVTVSDLKKELVRYKAAFKMEHAMHFAGIEEIHELNDTIALMAKEAIKLRSELRAITAERDEMIRFMESHEYDEGHLHKVDDSPFDGGNFQ